MLRAATLEPETERSFDRRVLRKARVQTVRESFAYWMPAMIGCFLAFVAVLSTLDLLAAKSKPASVKISGGEAFRTDAYPRFELTGPLNLR